MREIKFRGKFLSGNKFIPHPNEGKWVYGDLFHDAIFHCDGFTDAIYQDGGAIPVDKKTIGQFTGLLDKDGKEIYEGDVIECGRENYVCEFVEGGFVFRDTFDGGLTLNAIVIHSHIIGNIHDNPGITEMVVRTMKVLELPLKKEWYNMIESGEKREEYREIKPYWNKRLLGFDVPLFSHRYGYQQANVKGYTHVRFRYGYTKRTMLYIIDEITIGRGNPHWGAPTDKDVFIIKFH